MSSTKTIVLRGLQPQPLSGYLGALGVLRLATAGFGAGVRGAFGPDGFHLTGVDGDELVTFLAERWAPSPVVTPWNNASGFYESSKGQLAADAIAAILASSEPRFGPLASTLRAVRGIVAAAGFTDAPKDEEKARFIGQLRNVLDDDAVVWLDAVASVDKDDVVMMPLLGSGGNEGVLDYSGFFLRSLTETLLGDRASSENLLRAALLSATSDALLERPAGQFDPGSAGGFNTGPGFEAKQMPNNPWTFLLLIEGTLVWTSGIGSRQAGAQSDVRMAVSPFTVRHRAAGYGSAGRGDDDPQRVRAEVWLPLWHRPASLAEVQRMIAEGRADVSGRRGMQRAADSLDFADAVASLGVDRGIDSFVRYALIKRRGDSFLALPTQTLDVSRRREADLLRQLDGEMDLLDGFLSRFPSGSPPAQFTTARRRVDDARLNVATRGGPAAMTRLVRALGAMEMLVAARPPGRTPSLLRPLGGLGVEWITVCEPTPELRLAAALSSLGRTGDASVLRPYLAPVLPDQPSRFAPAARTLAWSGADVADRLAQVLHRRLLDVRRGGGVRNPAWGQRRAGLEDVAAFLEPGLIDEAALEELLFGLCLVRPDHVALSAPSLRGAPLPRVFALLKLAFLPDGVPLPGGDTLPVVADAAVLPLLRAGRVGDAVSLVSRQLRARGLRPRRVIDEPADDARFGRRLAAALLIPCTGSEALVAAALLPFDDDTTTAKEMSHD